METDLENLGSAIASELKESVYKEERLLSFLKGKPKKRIELTNRDFEIIEFILDMKFASVEEVFIKFFSITRENENAKSLAWAKKRLYQLEHAKFLNAVYNYSNSVRYYTATYKGYYALVNFKPELMLAKPTGGFDQRTFEHDKTVLKARILLEKEKKVTSWLSDRRLKATPDFMPNLALGYFPDAIYLDASGRKVALEVEIAVKAKSRYLDKIKRYLSVMRNLDPNSAGFEKCLYVCSKKSVANNIKYQTGIYGDLFEVQTFDEFFGTTKGQV
jgi:hypothetical protein